MTAADLQACWAPLGRALADYCQGDREVVALAHAGDGEYMKYPISVFFRTPAEMPELELQALELCRGRVLDLGAGAGCHSLALQERELEVCALDVLPEAVRIMRQRGVLDARLGTPADLTSERFDTVLMLMHGIGFVGTLGGLHEFLQEAHDLVAPGGQMVFDSLDPRGTGGPPGQYEGEVEYRFEYDRLIGAPFRWLYVDPATLAGIARETGWRCRLARWEREGEDRDRYLACLERIR